MKDVFLNTKILSLDLRELLYKLLDFIELISIKG